MIEDPRCAGGQIRRCPRLVQVSIDVKAHDVWFPLKRESVKIVRELLSMGQCVGRTYAALTRVTRSMKSAMNDRRLFTDVFHDVDLAAVGPVGSIDVVTQHPKCRPDTLAVRDLNSRLKPSVCLAELILSEQSCGSVVANYLVRPGERFL